MNNPRNIEIASLSDIDGMIKILEQNLISKKNSGENMSSENLEEQGFLVTPFDKEEITKMIQDPKNHIILTLKEEGEIIGYLVSYDLKEADNNLKNQFEESLKNSPNNFQKILYYKQIAKKSKTSGIGTILLEAMTNKARAQNYEAIICQIVQAPIQNKISTNFHQKFGFEKIGSSQREEITLGIFLKGLV